jgi:Protein of unknown function (DUF3551)
MRVLQGKSPRTTLKPVLIAAIAVATASIVSCAEAQNYPWCAYYSGDMDGTTNCGFVSFEQCMNTVRGVGGFCQQNNTYVPPGGAAAQSSRARKPS